MALEVVSRIPFAFDIFGDGTSTAITLTNVASTNIRAIGALASVGAGGVTVAGSFSLRNITLTFSAPFTGVARVSGEFVAT